MGKDHSSFNAKRKNSRSRNLKKIILYVEGRNTEYSYLKQLKRANCKVEPVPVRGNGIGNCMDFVNTSIGKFNSLPKKEKEKYSGKYNRGIQMYRFPNSDVQKSVIFEGIKKRLKIV